MGRSKIFSLGFQRYQVPLVFAVMLWGHCASGARASGRKPGLADGIFTNDVVLQLQIEISDQGMATLRQYHWTHATQPGERIPVPATVREGATVYTNVAVHLKGSVGSFRPVDDKPGLTLNFDKFAKGQRFHGLSKISLNNSAQDPSYITDKLCRELFEKAGVPVPRAGYATVKLNDRALGLYVMTEGWNKQFLKHYFKNTSGNLYDGGFVKDVSGPLIVNSGDNPTDQSAVRTLISAAREPTLTNRLARLEKILNLDRFITFLALDVLVWDWDGYALNRNNYRFFQDLDSGRFEFFPHGMDQMFWNAEGPIMPGMRGFVADSVMQIPECQRLYMARISELMTNICRVEALTNRVERLSATIRPALGTESGTFGGLMRGLFEGNPVQRLTDRIVRRGRSLEEQLRGIKTLMVLEPGASAPLTGWKAKTSSGRLLFKEMKGQRPVLLLSAQEPGAAGAWRTTVWLQGGHYQIVGKARVQGMTANSSLRRSGAGFRVFSHRKLTNGPEWDWFPYRASRDMERRGELSSNSPRDPNRRLSGSTDWTEIRYDFDLRQPAADLEISCELCADEGEAWFELASLRIIRQ